MCEDNEHHAKYDLQAEFRGLCRKNKVPLDERYALDGRVSTECVFVSALQSWSLFGRTWAFVPRTALQPRLAHVRLSAEGSNSAWPKHLIPMTDPSARAPVACR